MPDRFRVYVKLRDGREILYGVLVNVPRVQDLPFAAESIRTEKVEET